MTVPLLQVENLRTSFFTDQGVVRVVDGVSFSVKAGQTLGIVGESGCGKSVTSLSVMRLLPPGVAQIESGSVRFDGRDLLKLSEREMRRLRGSEIAMIFQEPMSALNPVYRVGEQIAETLRCHERVSRRAARSKAIEMLRLVGIASPELRVDAYPHELSGGMRQRVLIAIALVCEPRLLIADEPTTALDVTIQAQILRLLSELRERLSMSIVFITHDFGVLAEFVDEVLVMYAGKAVEQAATADIFSLPRHPYTRGLLSSIPGLDINRGRDRLPTIPGIVPALGRLPKGCRFQDRCALATSECRQSEPSWVWDRSAKRGVACFRTQKVRPLESGEFRYE